MARCRRQLQRWRACEIAISTTGAPTRRFGTSPRPPAGVMRLTCDSSSGISPKNVVGRCPGRREDTPACVPVELHAVDLPVLVQLDHPADAASPVRVSLLTS